MSTPLASTRKTRIVCISDTHNQTPSLPKGDVLIHAGDLTNQGTLPELQKTVRWLEKADFEAKIVVVGNHDLTLDGEFYEREWREFHNQGKQDAEACRRLLRESPSITYLDHEAKHVKLTRPEGPRTHFEVFGSPYSPHHGLWAFSYTKGEAQDLWAEIPLSTDILITHTPPEGHCDRVATGNKRAGCPALLHRLSQVRPRLHVCGHLHEGRGAESILWRDDGSRAWYEESFRYWNDPGAGEGNRKQSLLSLLPEKQSEWFSTRVARSKARAKGRRSASEEGSESSFSAPSDVETAEGGNGDQLPLVSRVDRSMSCVVNAAIMQNSWGGPRRLNKPIVVDIDLPVWNG